MPSFTALPVRGDSFLLCTGQKKILVDGGYNSAALIAATSGVDHLDVVICTHGDRDHAGGLTDLLSQPGAPKVGEFWLPGRWADHLEALLTDPDGFVARLGEEVYSILADRPDFDASLPYEETILGDDEALDVEDAADGTLPPPSDTILAPTPPWWAALADRVLQTPGGAPHWQIPAAPVQDPSGPLTADEQAKRKAVVAAAIDTALLIYEIAKQAAMHRVPVRWFNFEAFARGKTPNGGWPRVLEPINACELVAPPKPPKTSFAYYVALSRINRQSLVFQAIESPEMPSVLFCGDSPLRGGRRKPWPGLRHVPMYGLLATAPHHGRKSNADAYAIVDSWGARGRVIWVKAGNSGPPCSELQERERTCTQCIGVGLRPAHLSPARSRPWGWWSHHLPCGAC